MIDGSVIVIRFEKFRFLFTDKRRELLYFLFIDNFNLLKTLAQLLPLKPTEIPDISVIGTATHQFLFFILAFPLEFDRNALQPYLQNPARSPSRRTALIFPI